MNALDVVSVVLRALAAIAVMIQRGVTREQALTRIHSITADLKGVDADIDAVLRGVSAGE